MSRGNSQPRASRTTEPELSHDVPYDSPRYYRGRSGQARCGAIVPMRQHSLDPTCRECAEAQQADPGVEGEDEDLPLAD